MKKPFITLVILILVLVAVMAILWNKPFPGAVPGSQPGMASTSTAPILGGVGASAATTTLRGTFACLPHANAGPGTVTTMECAYGLKADSGLFYALDMSGVSTSVYDLPMGREYDVTGVLTPVASLGASNYWSNYDIAGAITVLSYSEASDSVPAAQAGTKITVGLGKQATVSGTTFAVTGVIQDSRCPSDAHCIQAGRVVISLYTASAASTSTTQTTIGHTVTSGGVALTLDDVQPYPVSTHRITDQEYEFTFSVSKI